MQSSPHRRSFVAASHRKTHQVHASSLARWIMCLMGKQKGQRRDRVARVNGQPSALWKWFSEMRELRGAGGQSGVMQANVWPMRRRAGVARERPRCRLVSRRSLGIEYLMAIPGVGSMGFGFVVH
ncbi:hypothetical protein IQ07DRAFT_150415 [Pyrenochaeta sp. DS3sAY3a]|nr:hypothetical protein IQ07DRAFT_150415 [Pyrenochaeta sp. DS3sAY3a]